MTVKPCHQCGMFSYGDFPCRWCEVMAENPVQSEPVTLGDVQKSIDELRSTLRFWLLVVLLLVAWGIFSVLFLVML